MTVLDVRQSIEIQPKKRVEGRTVEGYREEDVMTTWAVESISGRNFRRRAAVSPSNLSTLPTANFPEISPEEPRF